MDLVTETCDWGNLIDLLQEGVEERSNENKTIVKNIKDVMGKRNLQPLLLHEWYTIMLGLGAKLSTTYHKRTLQKHDLKIRAVEIYKEILQMCGTEKELLRIKSLIDDGPEVMKKISGRTIDTLVTRFPRYHNVCYYLDVTDPKNTFIVDSERGGPGKRVVLFDIGGSYRQKMHQYSKMYFDCFGRGDEVDHRLESGQVLKLSLCQYTFFVWADRFKVFDFLEQEYSKIVLVRQQSQKNSYKPIRKRRRKTTLKPATNELKKVLLCPPVKHHHCRNRSVVTMCQERKEVKPVFRKCIVPALF